MPVLNPEEEALQDLQQLHSPAEATGQVGAVVGAARKRLGERCGPEGCAAFVSRSIKDAGYDFGSPSSHVLRALILRSGGQEVSDPQPGDIFFHTGGPTGYSHTGIVGPNSIIDAPGRSAGYKSLERPGGPRLPAVYVRLPSRGGRSHPTPEVQALLPTERGGSSSPEEEALADLQRLHQPTQPSAPLSPEDEALRDLQALHQQPANPVVSALQRRMQTATPPSRPSQLPPAGVSASAGIGVPVGAKPAAHPTSVSAAAGQAPGVAQKAGPTHAPLLDPTHVRAVQDPSAYAVTHPLEATGEALKHVFAGNYAGAEEEAAKRAQTQVRVPKGKEKEVAQLQPIVQKVVEQMRLRAQTVEKNRPQVLQPHPPGAADLGSYVDAPNPTAFPSTEAYLRARDAYQARVNAREHPKGDYATRIAQDEQQRQVIYDRIAQQFVDLPRQVEAQGTKLTPYQRQVLNAAGKAQAEQFKAEMQKRRGATQDVIANVAGYLSGMAAEELLAPWISKAGGAIAAKVLPKIGAEGRALATNVAEKPLAQAAGRVLSPTRAVGNYAGGAGAQGITDLSQKLTPQERLARMHGAGVGAALFGVGLHVAGEVGGALSRAAGKALKPGETAPQVGGIPVRQFTQPEPREKPLEAPTAPAEAGAASPTFQEVIDAQAQVGKRAKGKASPAAPAAPPERTPTHFTDFEDLAKTPEGKTLSHAQSNALADVHALLTDREGLAGSGWDALEQDLGPDGLAEVVKRADDPHFQAEAERILERRLAGHYEEAQAATAEVAKERRGQALEGRPLVEDAISRAMRIERDGVRYYDLHDEFSQPQREAIYEHVRTRLGRASDSKLYPIPGASKGATLHDAIVDMGVIPHEIGKQYEAGVVLSKEYAPRNKEELVTALRGAAKLKPKQASDVAEIWDAYAQARAKTYGKSVEQVYEDTLKGMVRGGKVSAEALLQEAKNPAPPFYSQAERVVEQKMPNRASVAQLRGTLNSGGVKPEELLWTGLDEWLGEKERAGAPVTKAEVQEFLKNNRVEVKEVEHRDPTPDEEEASYRGATDLPGEPKFGQYALPGGKNYRELLLTLPKRSENLQALRRERDLYAASDNPAMAQEYQERIQRRLKEGDQDYHSGYWDEPNVLAHVRFDERTDAEGKPVLHVAEIQSDMHQAGRKSGYTDSADFKRYDELLQKVRRSDGSPERPGLTPAEREEYHALKERVSGAVPAAPFSKTWHEMAFRRIARFAAENGFDRVTWDTGATAAERFDLSKQVKNIDYRPETHELTAWGFDDKPLIEKVVPPNNLPDYIGKEVTERLLQSEPETTGAGKKIHRLAGPDLKVGGEGMKGFYDRILPQYAEKFGKKWGAKVGKTEVPLATSASASAAAQHGYRLFNADDGWQVLGPDGDPLRSFGNDLTAAIAFRDEQAGVSARMAAVHSLDITPEMRQSLVHEGTPLFQGEPAAPKGSVSFDDLGRAFIRFFQSSDVSTAVHEIGHVLRRWLEGDDLKVAEEWAEVENGEWTRTHEEKFARGFERYLRDGKAPTDALKAVFARMRDWLIGIYKRVTGSEIDVKVSPEMRDLFDRQLGGEGYLKKAADREAAKLAAKPKPDYIGSINANKLNVPPEAKEAIREAYQGAKQEADAFRRGARPNDQTLEAARRLLKTEKITVESLKRAHPGQAWNAEQLEAIGMLHLRMLREMQAAETKYATSGSVEDYASLVDAKTKYEVVSTAHQGGATEVGRALQARKLFKSAYEGELAKAKVEELYKPLADSPERTQLRRQAAVKATVFPRERGVAALKALRERFGVPKPEGEQVLYQRGQSAAPVDASQFGASRRKDHWLVWHGDDWQVRVPIGRASSTAEAVRIGQVLHARGEAAHPLQFDQPTPEGGWPGFKRATDDEWRAAKGRPDLSHRWLNEDPNGIMFSRGKDEKGRWQRQYRSAHRDAADIEKFQRVRELAPRLETVLEKSASDLRSGGRRGEDALAARVVTQTGMRIGGKGDTGGAAEAFGATTLGTKHVRIESETAVFEFPGKKGTPQDYRTHDPLIVAEMRRRIAKGGDQLFDTNAARTKAYLRETSGLAEVKNHDLRTYNATRAVQESVRTQEPPANMREFRERRLIAEAAGAKQINDTIATARKSYIDPSIFNEWQALAEAGERVGAGAGVTPEDARSLRNNFVRSGSEFGTSLEGGATRGVTQGTLFQKPGSSIPPDLRGHLIDLGGWLVESKFNTETTWRAEMTKQVGAGVEPYLPELWKLVKAEAQAQLKKNAATKLPADKAKELLDKIMGGREAGPEVLARMKAAGNDPVALAKVLKDQYRPSASEVFLGTYKSGLTMGPGTHMTNIVSTLGHLQYRRFDKFFAGLWDPVVSKLTGAERQHFIQEAAPNAAAMQMGFRSGLRDFAQTMREGATEENLRSLDVPRELPGGLKNPFVVNQRLLGAEDAFNKALVYHEATFSEATRLALKEGLKGDQLKVRVAELLDSDAVKEAAAKEAKEYTFNSDPEGWAKTLLKLRSDLGVAGHIAIPFASTPINVAKSAWMHSPLGFLTALRRIAVKGDVSDALGKATTGTLLLVGLGSLLKNVEMTGPLPQDSAARDDFYRSGRQPYALRIGDRWVSYSGQGPLTTTLAMLASMREDYWKRGKEEPQAVWVRAAFAAAQNIKESSALTGLSSLSDAIDNPDRKLNSYLKSQAQGLVPFSGLLRAVQKSTDPYLRETKTPAEAVQSIIPGATRSLPVKQDTFGRAVKREPGGPLAAQRFLVGKVSQDTVDAELHRLKVFPSLLNDKVKVGNEEKTLTRAQHAEYVRLVGEVLYSQLKQQVSTPGYQSPRVTDEIRAKVVKQIIDHTRSHGEKGKDTPSNLRYGAEEVLQAALARKEDPIKLLKVWRDRALNSGVSTGQ